MITKILNKFGLYTKKQILERLDQSLERHSPKELPESKYTELYNFGGYSTVLAIREDMFGY